LQRPIATQRFAGVSEAYPGTPRKRQMAPVTRTFDPRLDTPLSHQKKQRQGPSMPQGLDEAIRRNAGGNDVMAAILTDTASTTLNSQNAHDRPSSSSKIVQEEQFDGAPEQVFGESASRWASLAFGDVKKTA
jgi:hypothetical protein